MTRTPYNVGPYGVDQYRSDLGPSPLAGKEGYIFVYQDVRGRWMSEGEFVNLRPHRPEKKGPAEIDESSDTWDTIEWLLAHVPGHNGKVGLWGISYPGFYAATGMIDAHPALDGGLAAGANLRLVRRRRLAPPRGLDAAARLQLHGQLRTPAARTDEQIRTPLRTRHPRRLSLLSRYGSGGQRQ